MNQTNVRLKFLFHFFGWILAFFLFNLVMKTIQLFVQIVSMRAVGLNSHVLVVIQDS